MRLLLILILSACGSGDPCETAPDDLELTPESHESGWGRATCATCHPSWTYHQVDCYGFNVDKLQDLSDPTDPGTCTLCHGENGAEWTTP